VARKASLTSLTGKARDKLVTVVEEEYDRAVAGHVETLNTKEFDDILKSIAENQALCLSIDGNCDEDLLSPVQLRRRNQIYQSAARKRTLEFAAIEKEAERYAAKMRNWPRSLASVLAVRSQSVLQDRAIGVTTNIANLVATEGQMLRSAVEECRSGRSCVRTEVGDEVFSTFKPAMSERYQKICGSSASIGDCRVLSVSSDRPGESVRLGGVVAGVTPLLAVISPRVDVVLSVGDGDWRIDTTVRIVNDFPELSASVVTSLDPGKSSVPSRAALESTMAKDLPSVPLVNRFTLAAPARPSRSRMTAIWGIGTLVSGALFAATCDRSLCTPVIGFRDGVTLGGGVFMPAILWGSLRGYRKEVSVFNARKLEHENLSAGRDSVVARRLRMLDSAHEAESKRIRNLRPIRSFSFDQKLGRH
jgi:hypothetical protein